MLKTDSTALNNSFVIQSLLQTADQLTGQPFGLNSTLTVLGEQQYATSNSFNTNFNNSSNSNGVKIEEVDEGTANQILQSLSTTSVNQQYQWLETDSTANSAVNAPTSALTATLNYAGELFQDPNPPQIIRRPPPQGPITYRQNVSVRYLQPPPVPPPGPLIIKEVRPPQPPAPPPLVVRQRAAPLPTPPPLILRERPPQAPTPIPSQTVIKKLPPIPVPPRSVIIERYPAYPARPRDVIIERWLPYSKEPQKRKVIVYRAPPPQPYPPPRNTIVVYDPIQANVVRSVQKLGVQPQNPQEYVLRYGTTLLDGSTLVTQAQSVGIVEDLSPPLGGFDQQYQSDVAEYYLSTTQTLFEPAYEYSTTTSESQATNNNERKPSRWEIAENDFYTFWPHL